MSSHLPHVDYAWTIEAKVSQDVIQIFQSGKAASESRVAESRPELRGTFLWADGAFHHWCACMTVALLITHQQ